jgi:hypothetical protein
MAGRTSVAWNAKEAARENAEMVRTVQRHALKRVRTTDAPKKGTDGGRTALEKWRPARKRLCTADASRGNRKNRTCREIRAAGREHFLKTSSEKTFF